ncbi:MAG: hypothetical protein A2X64_06500 [Ignavibacteria bacterium GWF2_33_9]|nr:MAG: hypothetical protein A2X64_06500 [Ignavibacteria bacterium GWF2_33_9]
MNPRKLFMLGLYPEGALSSYLIAPYILKSYLISKPAISNTLSCEVFCSGVNAANSKIIEELEHARPDYVGICCYSWNIEKVLEIIRELRTKLSTKVLYILGGPEITEQRIKTFPATSIADYYIMGEGERPLYSLLSKILNCNDETDLPAKGIYKIDRIGDEGTRVTNLDEIPSVYMSEVIPEKLYARRQAFIETQRGCRFKCKYCVYHKHLSKITYYSLDRVSEEINFLVKNKGLQALRFLDGIFTSDDGGSTWKVRTSEYGVIDMEFKPGDANIVYASTYGFSGTNSIIKSTDGGVTWNLLHQINNTYRLNIEVTPKAPNYIYCLSAATDAGFNSIEVSDDEGNSWTEVSDLSTAGNVLGWYYGSSGDTGGQGIYDLALAVSPKDENLLFTGGINIWKSTTMGTDLDLNTHWFGYDSKPFVHADIHDLKFSPSGKRLYACNDGGISFTANNGADWTDLTNGINITQFYRLSSSDSYPSVIIAGAQDNGSSGLIDGTWKHLSAGDGMECLVHPTNPQRIYTSIYYGTFYRSNNGGQNYSTIITRKTTGENSGWVTPFVLNPSNPSTLLCGHQNVWINRRGGDVGQWSKISDFGSSQVLKAIAVAPSDSNVIYACNTTTLFVTYDGGLNWNNILTSGSSSLTYIVVDPKRPERIWVTKSGFTLSDKVWEYDGENWINISGNLPNIPVNTIAYQKNSPDRLYVGTDFGVYYSDYNSAYWEKFGTGMPNLVVNELEINYSSKTMLRAATYGRGVWECEVMDCNLPQPVINIFGDTEFCEGKSVKLELEGDYDNFVWSNGEQTKSITVKDNGAYSVIIFNDNGCNAKSQAVNVKVNQNRIMSVTADLGHFALCGDETALELRASIGFDQYLWSTGETTRRITITEPGDYYVLGITDDGCQTNSDTLHIVRSDNPTKPSINRDGRILTASDGYSYQWYRNGKKITDSTGQTYTLSEEDIAIFKVEIFNEAGCSNFSDDFDVENSVNEYDNNSNHLSISPNPNFGKFHVNFKGIISSDAQLEILDLTGQIVYIDNIILSNNSLELNLTNIPTGSYILRIITKDKIYTQKWIKN